MSRNCIERPPSHWPVRQCELGIVRPGYIMSKRHFRVEELAAKYLAPAKPLVHTRHRGGIHFDYLFAYTSSFKSPSEMVGSRDQTRQTALWLTSFLAHWGMFRGKSQIAKRNLVFFEELVQALLHPRNGALIPFFGVGLDQLYRVGPGTIDSTLGNAKIVLKEFEVSSTDTLVSKIVLALTNTTPGFDRYVVAALRDLHKKGVLPRACTFTGKGLSSLSEWVEELHIAPFPCETDSRRNLPIARVLDMALTVHGKKKVR